MRTIENVCALFVLLLFFLLVPSSVVQGSNFAPSLYQLAGVDYHHYFNADDMIRSNNVNPGLGRYYPLDCYYDAVAGAKIYFPPGANSMTIQTTIDNLVGSCGEEDYAGRWEPDPFEVEAYADPDCLGANVVFTGSRTHSFAGSFSSFTLYATNPQATQGNWVYLRFTKCSNAWNCRNSVGFSHSYGNIALEIYREWYDRAEWQANGDPPDSCSSSTPVSYPLTINPTPTYTSNELEVKFDPGVQNAVGAVNYEWSFGDGSTSGEAEPTHTYATAGTYSVTLTASDSNESVNNSAKPLIVTVTEPLSPVSAQVTLSADKTEGVAPLSVTVTADVVGLSNIEGFQYSWRRSDVGNPITTEINSNTFTFDNAGEYTIGVGVHDPAIGWNGYFYYEEEPIQITVTEEDPPSDLVTLSTTDATTGAVPMTVTVTATLSDELSSEDLWCAWKVNGEISKSYQPGESENPNIEKFDGLVKSPFA